MEMIPLHGSSPNSTKKTTKRVISVATIAIKTRNGSVRNEPKEWILGVPGAPEKVKTLNLRLKAQSCQTAGNLPHI